MKGGIKAIIFLVIFLVSLFCVYSVTDSDSQTMILNLAEEIQILKEAQISAYRLDDIYNRMEASYKTGDYAKVSELDEESAFLIATTYELQAIINETDFLVSSLESRGYNLSDILINYTSGVNEFNINNYESAEILLLEVQASVRLLLDSESEKIISRSRDYLAELNTSSESGSLISGTIAELEKAIYEKDYTKIFSIESSIDDLGDVAVILNTMDMLAENLSHDGYSTARISDMRSSADSHIKNRDFEAFFSTANDTLELMSLIYNLDDRYNTTETQINQVQEMGANTEEAMFLLNSSKREFLFENYERAEELLDETDTVLRELEEKHILTSILIKTNARFNIIEFLKKNWIGLLIFTMIGYFAVKISILYIQLKLSETRESSLKKESVAIKGLLKQIQRDYFKTKSIDTQTYESQKEKHEKRSDDIDNELPMLKNKISHLETRLRKYGKLYSFIQLVSGFRKTKPAIIPKTKESGSKKEASLPKQKPDNKKAKAVKIENSHPKEQNKNQPEKQVPKVAVVRMKY